MFTNGGFEAGNLSSWTKSTFLNNTGLLVVPPTTVADLQLTNGGTDFTSAVTGATPESVPLAGLTAGTGVPAYPRFGSYSAVINEYASTIPSGQTFHQGANNNVNSIKQSMATTQADLDPADNKLHVRFVLTPELQAAGHASDQQPYFFVVVRNTTKNTVLYTNFNFANQAGVPWSSQGTGANALLFTPWQLFDLVPDDASFTLGDTIEVEVFAAGCQPGGHSGSAYVDGFGASLPGLFITKTAPAQINIDTDLTYTFRVENNTTGVVPNVVADEVLPPNTTFVSYSAPGATCTVPTVGQPGTVTCNYGWMNPSASNTFTVTVHAYTPATQGTTTGSTAARIDDTAQAWTANAWGGYSAYVTSGAQATQQAFIQTNTATRLNFIANLPGAPGTGVTYKVVNPPAVRATATGGGNSTLTLSTATWVSNQWLGWNVMILSGTGAGQVRTITQNTATQLTVDNNWGTNPNNTSVFAINRPVSNIVNGNYGVQGPTISRLLGPKRETAITTGAVFADLQVSMTGPGPAVAWGSTPRYTITVTNAGPSNATNATVTYALPAQVSAVAWTCSGTGGATCPANGSGAINALVTVPVGGTVTFLVDTTIIAGSGAGSVTHLAQVATPAGVTDPVAINNSSSVTTSITSTLRALTANKDPASTGTGTVSSTPTGISCGVGCTTQTVNFADNQSVTLTAIASPNNRFAGWSGACSGTSPSCTLTMDAAKTATATFTSCGNGVLDATEGCDDGNVTAGDGCNASCRVENTFTCNVTAPGLTGNASCASGQCDTLGNAAPGRCEALNTCGNGLREASEGCDDGNVTAGDGCSATCLVENTFTCNASAPGFTGNASCASGVCDAVGNTAPGKCEAANTCGNGTREAGEGCDDGNTTAGDGCNATCRVENSFACNASAPGLTGGASCVSTVCDTVGNAAPGRCEAANTCGNGTREAGEGCDDGNTTSSDGCSATCLIETGTNCNASAPGLTGNASCVSGLCDTVGNPAPGRCEASNACGNGVREAGEGCDDGNGNNGDGCSTGCLVENTFACNATAPGFTGSSSCASGVCDAVGNAAPGRCEPANTCGNGVREAGEGCDDGNIANGDGCTSACRVENTFACNASAPGLTGGASCASAVCDILGNAAPGRCEAANACGNGAREAGEGCDDGNTTSGDGCSAACLVEVGGACNGSAPGLVGNASCTSGVCDTLGNAAPGRCEAASACGNGVLDLTEGCDDGNLTSGDGCSATCRVENGNACNATAPGLVGNNSCVSGVCDTVGNTAPGQCEPANFCGNGVREAGEGCDDGNVTAGDGCSATCLIENAGTCNASAPGLTGNASCSSGICDTSGNAAPGKCEAANACGNGVREAGEGCDDGNLTAGDGCSAACLIEDTGTCNASAPGLTGGASCASGVCDTTGNAAPGKCEAANACGNGALESGEGCDDGNLTAGDGCSATCLVELGGTCNASGGLTGGASCATGVCDATGNAPPGKCEAANVCGNGTRETGEGCDDGNTAANDGCSATCLVENGGACTATGPGPTGNASCASGVCDTTGGAPGVCEAANTCGNGKLETGEGCDDGNATPNDGCSAACLVENGGACNASASGSTGNASCVSGVCDTAGGAPGICKASNICGNGVKEAGEGCDDSNTTAGDGCSATCLVETGGTCNASGPGSTGNASCASGICDTVGNPAPGKCEAAGVCGNGVKETGEGCDDGNTAANDGCSATCLVENGSACSAVQPGATGNASCASGVCDAVGNPAPGKCEPANTCGNGVREASEGCDDGNLTAGDGCSATCLIDNGNSCNGAMPGLTGNASCSSGLCDPNEGGTGKCKAANTCGNGVRESGEGCDDSNTVAGDGCNPSCLLENGKTCNAATPGATGNASCESGVCDTTAGGAGSCKAANVCGNGKLEAGEGCDDGNTAGGDGCNPMCKLENGKACNAMAPGSTGNASCASSICDTTGNAAPGKCEAANSCGNGVREASEGCDDGNVAAGDGCAAGCLIETGKACNATSPGFTGNMSCVTGVCDTSKGAPGTCSMGVGAMDTDGDGVDDAVDLDDDNDGIPDTAEGGPDTDTDGDGVPDRLDLDSDNDGILDAVEAGHAQAVSAKGTIACGGGFGANGLCDAVETQADSGTIKYTVADTDKDGVADFRDLDSDGDGLLDIAEGNSVCADADADGLCDGADADHDGVVGAGDELSGFGVDKVTSPPDTDGDGVADFRDLDSDNDGIPDLIEGGTACADADQNALCDGADADQDGIADGIDGQKTKRGTSNRPAALDTDGDGVPDFRDLDSDDDALSDLSEGKSACADDDGNGVCDGADSDGDGLRDGADGARTNFGSGSATAPGVPDTDGDGLPDYRDLDSDGDGTFDIVKSGHPRLDADGDGKVDDPNDADHDGIRDAVDAAPDTFGGLPPPPAVKVMGGGCGCGASETSAPWLWLSLAALARLALGRRRLRRSSALKPAGLALAVALVAAQAPAQTSTALDVQFLKPGPGRLDIFDVLSPRTCGPGCVNVGMWLQYTLNPLVIVDATNNQRIGRLVDNQLTADLLGQWDITDRLAVGLHLPVYVEHGGATDLTNSSYVGEGWSFGPGDLRLIPRVRIWSFESGVHLGLAVPVVLPTGRRDSFMGGGFVGVQPKALVELKNGPLRVAANVGINVRKLEVLQNVRAGHEFAWSLAGAYFVEKYALPFALQAGVHGVLGLSGGGVNGGTTPTEVDLGWQAFLKSGWTLGFTLGRGIISGVGAPDLRVAINAAYTFEREKVLDRDGDGIIDSADGCIDEPEDKDGFEDTDGCPDPDNDKDTILDVVDKCPLQPETVNGYQDADGCPDAIPDTDGDGLADDVDKCPKAPEDKDGFEDADGCPDPDNDQDGIPDVKDKCPDSPEDKDGFEDDDGCPDPDNDKDGIPDVKDKCPDQPETINGVEDEDGCPDQGATKVKLEGNKIVILDKVYFATNKDVILERSFNLLTQVASTLKAHGELKKIRVEGHTDSQGNDAANLDLSQRRANSVVRFLVERGIEADRLLSVGYGENKPVADNKTAAGREMNRRVEFVIVDTGDGAQ
ncbi:MAG: OmpA family protein [Myxococcaceae bacterium]|nr:OmpA family protein [Myxococcaceae bacterium]